MHGVTALGWICLYIFPTNTKMHKHKMTKCPSVHGMTALGRYLPLHSSVARGRPTAVQQGGRRHARTFKDLTEAGR